MKGGDDILDAYLDHLRIERRLSPRSVISYRSDLVQHLAFLDTRSTADFTAVRTEILRDDLERLHRAGRARRSIQRYRSALRGFYRHLMREGWIPADPSRELEGPRSTRSLPHSLSREEIERLLSATAGREALDLRDRALLEVAYGAGLRASELVGLGAEQIDLENRWIRVRGKGDRERIVPLGRPACAAVRSYLSRGRPQLCPAGKTSRLFVNRRGGPLSRMGFFRVIRKRGAAAGLDPSRLHPHLLRHTFATHMLEQGASLRIVQELLGHRSLTTTEIYTAVDQATLRKVHRRFHPRGGGSMKEVS
jgi:site-specific recombinase XerD